MAEATTFAEWPGDEAAACTVGVEAFGRAREQVVSARYGALTGAPSSRVVPG